MEAFTMKFKLKDPGSAITHGIALLLAAVGAVPLIIKAARSYDVIHIVALSIFILTMILLYAASTIYHSVDSTETLRCASLFFTIILAIFCVPWYGVLRSLA